MEIKITSYNCDSVRNSSDTVKILLNNHDIVLLQETLLTDDNLDYLNMLDENFNHSAVPSTYYKENFKGRPRGGLAIFWSKNLSKCVTATCYTDRIMGIKIAGKSKTYLILNAYMPCDYGGNESLFQYRNTMTEIEDILESESFDDVIVVGDLNCDPNKGRFFAEFSRLVTTHSLTFADLVLPQDSITYISKTNCFSTSWLDHIVISNDAEIKDIEIYNGMTVQDHIPIKFNLVIPHDVIMCDDEITNKQIFHYILWDKITDEDIDVYHDNLNYLLSDYLNEAFMCHDISCANEEHKRSACEAYHFISDCLHVAAGHFKSRSSGTKFKSVSGWNDFCKDLHADARADFVKWNDNGRIRQGAEFDVMKGSRTKFRNALNYCKANELKIKKEKLLESYKCRNKNNFWKEIKTLKLKSKQSVNAMDEATTSEDIIKIFENKYKGILDDETSQIKPSNFNETLQDLNNRHQICSGQVMLHQIEEAIEKLKTGVGFDFLHSNHFKLSNNLLKSLLGRLFSTFISHSYMPKDILHGEIRPIVKNPIGNKND